MAKRPLVPQRRRVSPINESSVAVLVSKAASLARQKHAAQSAVRIVSAGADRR
jgi:hypothetical protein